MKMFAEDRDTAILRFKEFNEIENNDKCLDEGFKERTRLSDEEARKGIVKSINRVEIAQIKSLPKLERDKILQRSRE